MGAYPALAINPPAAPQDPLEEFARVAQIKGQMQSQQLQNQELQIKQQQAQDLHATTAAVNAADSTKPSYFDDVTNLIKQNGGSANAQMAWQQHKLAVQDQQLKLTDAQRKQYVDAHKTIGDQLGTLIDPSITPDDQLPGAAHSVVDGLVKGGFLTPQEGQQNQQLIQQTQDPTQLRTSISMIAKHMQGAAAVAAQQKTEAETASDLGKARESNASAAIKEIEAKGLEGITPEFISKQVDGVYDPNGIQTGGQNRLVKGQALGALQRGDVQGAKQILSDAFKSQLEEKKSVAVETDPAVQIAKVVLAQRTKAAEQVITQGDPATAGRLLADGSLTLSELKSRGTTPQFIVQATNAAQEINPQFNPQKAEADLNIAKSPANQAFFGSAKSLTEKAGTLDQLAAAAKDIPGNQIPVFNTVADAIKASTGSGPIAKYAAIALGVADDYSKVMGGGQGSDTAREQALKLISAKQSPEQKAASIEGIRGAVTSQITSRIGKNPVLQKMYGEEPTTAQSSSQAPPTSGKAVSLAAAKQLPVNRGKSDEEIKADIQAHGHAVID